MALSITFSVAMQAMQESSGGVRGGRWSKLKLDPDKRFTQRSASVNDSSARSKKEDVVDPKEDASSTKAPIEQEEAKTDITSTIDTATNHSSSVPAVTEE